MTTDFEEFLEVGEMDRFVTPDQVSAAYSTRLAFNLLEADERPFTRIVEDVRTEEGECCRQLTVDWRLPTLEEAVPGAGHTRFTDLVVPLLPVGKDVMLSNFVVTGASGERLYVCGRDESAWHTRLVLETLWQWPNQTPEEKDFLNGVREDFHALPTLPLAEAVERVRSIVDRATSVGGGDSLERLLLLGRYLAKHHIIWLRLPGAPGDATRLTLTCRTRLVATRSPRRTGLRGRFQDAVDWARRVAGQEPYRYAVPAWTSALCHSYHFQMSAPPAMYFADQRFAMEKSLSRNKKEQREALAKHYGDTLFSGEDDAGGPVTHMYVRDLPPEAENELYAYTRLRERPPGSTAHVMWLATLTAGFLWFFFFSWQSMVRNDTQGIDLASLAIALLAVASIWFSRAFRDDVRSRVPLVSRLGLLLVGGSTVYSLLTILFHRVTCENPEQQAPVCPAGWPNVFSRWGFLTFALMVTAVVALLFARMIRFHRDYQRLQTRTQATRPAPLERPHRSQQQLASDAKAALDRRTTPHPEVSGEPIFVVPGMTSRIRLPDLDPRHTRTDMILRAATTTPPTPRADGQ